MPGAPDDAAPVAAVILSYDSKSTLGAVLERVAAQTVRPAHTIVVDNGSVDGSRALLKRTAGIETVLLDTNRGVGAGHNAGWRAALRHPDVHYVWALEHDSLPVADCLERLLMCAVASRPVERTAAVVPVQVTADGARGVTRTEPFPTGSLHFNGPLLARPTLDAVGLSSESFFCGHEDRELGLRFMSAGWQMLCEPRAVVVHANFGDARGSRHTIFRRYYGWRNDLWLRIHVRHEPWARLRAIAAATWWVALVGLGRRSWSEAEARLCATGDALTGRLGRREYRFLVDPELAGRPVRGRRRSHRARRSGR